MKRGNRTVGSIYNELVLLKKRGENINLDLFQKAIDDFSKMIDYSQTNILKERKEL